jgi:hypothetical protein
MLLRIVKGVGEKLHVGSGPPNVFLYLLPNDVVLKVLIPKTLLLDTEGVVVLVVLIVVFFIVHVWYHDQVHFQIVVDFLLLVHYALPFRCFSGEVT